MSSDDRSAIFNLNNTAGGDVIQQYGPGSVGKQVHMGSGDNVVSKTVPTSPVPPQTVNVQGDYVASDKASSHFGDVTHDFRRLPDGSSDLWTEDHR